jgi:hypothetical protein
MTAFLVLLTALVLAELVVGLRALRTDRPRTPPASRPDWSSGGLPSRPYALS